MIQRALGPSLWRPGLWIAGQGGVGWGRVRGVSLVEVLRRCGGRAGVDVLLRHGTRHQLRTAVDAGEIVRVTRGVYALPTLPARTLAAARAGGALCLEAAALSWDLSVLGSIDQVPVTVALRSNARRPPLTPGVTYRWCPLSAEELAEGRTGLLRTIFDCASVLPLPPGPGGCRRGAPGRPLPPRAVAGDGGGAAGPRPGPPAGRPASGGRPRGQPVRVSAAGGAARARDHRVRAAGADPGARLRRPGRPGPSAAPPRDRGRGVRLPRRDAEGVQPRPPPLRRTGPARLARPAFHLAAGPGAAAVGGGGRLGDPGPRSVCTCRTDAALIDQRCADHRYQRPVVEERRRLLPRPRDVHGLERRRDR